jgi:cell division protein FtsZ
MSNAPADRLFQHPGVEPRTRILVMGLGGAGCNAVANMSQTWREGPPVIALNTDSQSLAGCEAPRVLQIGESATQGLGANGDPNIGRLAMEESIEQVKELLEDLDILFLAIGLGGGTGSGGAPLLLQVAHQLGVMTICFATRPFEFEGDARKRQAEETLKAVQRAADAVVVLPNEKLINLVSPNAGLVEAFRTSDEQVAATIHALWHLLSFRGVMNLDFADLRSLVEKSRGLCRFGFGAAEGPARVASAVKALTDSPYLNQGAALAEASAVLINITGGPDLTLADMHGIMNQLGKLTRPGAEIYFGARIDPAMKNRVELTTIVTDAQVADTGKPVSRPLVEEGASRKGKTTAQTVLPLQTEDKGKFANVAPTTFRGEDIDIPTYIRRGYKLSFER